MNTTPDKPELYVRNYCGYCYKVMHTVKTLGLEVELKNIWADESASAVLNEATGGNGVPVLRYQDENGNDIWLPESDHIIDYLTQLSTQSS